MLTQRMGDVAAMGVLRTHDEIVREALRSAEGREVKHTGDGIMASFSSVARTAGCAIGIQRGLEEHNRTGEWPIRVRIGLSAGEPVTENDDLFGATVQLAARICAAAQAGTILASNAVKELSIGKGFRWEDRGETNLRGFEEPVRIHELVWAD